MPDFLKFFKREWASVAYTRTVRLPLEYPVVSFTFDDAPGSAFEHGGAALKKYGYTGTFYVSRSFHEDTGGEKTFTADQLKTAWREGHELACHTCGHIDLARTRLKTSISDLNENQHWIQQLLPGLIFENFSYPFGAQTAAIKKHLDTRFRSARGIRAGVNRGRLDLLNLKAIRLYERSLPLEGHLQRLLELRSRQGWLIFYTHDVSGAFSPHGCSPSYFEAIVKACWELQIEVRTVREVMQQIMPSAAPAAD